MENISQKLFPSSTLGIRYCFLEIYHGSSFFVDKRCDSICGLFFGREYILTQYHSTQPPPQEITRSVIKT